MRLTIKLKLAAAFTVLTLLVAGVAWVGATGLGSLNATIVSVIGGPVVRLRAADDLRLWSMEVGSEEKTLLLSSAPEETLASVTEVKRRLETFVNKLENVRKNSTAETANKLNSVSQSWIRWSAIIEKECALMQENRQEEAEKILLHESRSARKDLMKQLAEIGAIEEGLMKRAEEETASQYGFAWRLLVGAAGTALLFSVISGVLLSYYINRGLRCAISLADAVALGDVGAKVTACGNDEIKDLIESLNRMTANLSATADMAGAIADGD
jgi:methyl-accepting chemotaxis protein